MKTIIISGTPGTGKSTLAKVLSKKLKYQELDLKPIIKKISEGYDKEKECEIIDIKKFNKEIIERINKRNLIIASHLIHNLPKKYVDLCIITKCDLKELKKRLHKRKYSPSKVKENLECEIFDVCLGEAKKHKVLVVDTSKKIDIKELTKKIKRGLSH